MSFSTLLKESISDLNLLQHPFYQDWSEGKLSMDNLKKYAKNYYHHVAAFPRYISATHSLCEDISKRKILLENLMDEEGVGYDDHHPELWLKFSEGLGASREEVLEFEPSESVKNVVSNFMDSARSSYAEGLASLYAYEYQIPETATTKIEGLEKFYDIHDDNTLSFFRVHQSADVEHRKACEKLMDQFTDEEKEKALVAARKSAQTLWDFLTDMHDHSESACA